MKFIILIICMFCSCQANVKKQENPFYGNIYLTDGIETCLAKGTILSTGMSLLNPTGYTLANNSFEGILFEKSSVKFSTSNTIEYIKLITKHGYRESNASDNTESVYNQTLQRLCAQYSNMQMYTIDKTIKEDGYDRRMQGQGNKWETDGKIIKLEYYKGSVYDTSNQSMNAGGAVSFAMCMEEYSGNFVELTFEKR